MFRIIRVDQISDMGSEIPMFSRQDLVDVGIFVTDYRDGPLLVVNAQAGFKEVGKGAVAHIVQ